MNNSKRVSKTVNEIALIIIILKVFYDNLLRKDFKKFSKNLLPTIIKVFIGLYLEQKLLKKSLIF